MDQVTVIVKASAEVGEGPFWVPHKQIVSWVDIPAGQIFITDYSTTHTDTFQYKEMVGAAVPRRKGGMLAAVQSGFVGFNDSWEITERLDLLGDDFRMNDAKTDSSGRFWAGSNTIDFVPGEGSLWRLDEHWNATVAHSGLTLPNGIGWSPDERCMYLVDSMQRIVLQFDFDAAQSVIKGEPRVFAGPDVFQGLPDGLAVDTRGHLWIAEFGASQLSEFSPDGSLVSRVTIPTNKPTSCAFVGPELDKLWVTSAAIDLDPTVDPFAGSIFEITGLPARGVPVTIFNG